MSYAQKSFCFNSLLSNHNKSAEHIKKLESIKDTDTPFDSTSFVDCGEADIKLETKEESFEEDPLFIKLKAENEIEEKIKEKIFFLVKRVLMRIEESLLKLE